MSLVNKIENSTVIKNLHLWTVTAYVHTFSEYIAITTNVFTLSVSYLPYI